MIAITSTMLSKYIELTPHFSENIFILTLFIFPFYRFQGIEITEKRAYMDLPTTGYQGFQSKYRKPTTQINHRKDPFFNINPLRPKLNTDDVMEKDDAKKLSDTQTSALRS